MESITLKLEEADAPNRVAAFITVNWWEAGESIDANGKRKFGMMVGDTVAGIICSRQEETHGNDL